MISGFFLRPAVTSPFNVHRILLQPPPPPPHPHFSDQLDLVALSDMVGLEEIKVERSALQDFSLMRAYPLSCSREGETGPVIWAEEGRRSDSQGYDVEASKELDMELIVVIVSILVGSPHALTQGIGCHPLHSDHSLHHLHRSSTSP